MDSWIQRVRTSRFVRNVAKVTVGTAGAQLVVLGAAPLLSRIYSPAEYGVLAAFVSVFGVVSFLGSFNYELAIPIADTDREAKAAFALAFGFLVLSTLVLSLAVVLTIIFDWLDALYGIDTTVLALVPLGLLMMGIYGILTQWCFRTGDFGTVGRTKFTQSVAQVVTSAGLGIAGVGAVGLVAGKIVGQCGGWVVLLVRTLANELSSFKALGWRDFVNTARRFRDFAFFTTPRRYLGEVSLALPGLFLVGFYDSAAAGFYMLAVSTLQLPLNLVGNSVGSVYFAEAARLRRTDPSRIKGLSSRLFWTLLAIVVPTILVLVLFGSRLFGFVFGSEWGGAGQYAVVLSFGIGCRFVLKPISNIFDVFERQWLSLLLNILRVVLILGGFGLSILFGWPALAAVATYSVSTGAVYIIQYMAARRIMGTSRSP